MTEEQKEKFRKQLESYKKDLRQSIDESNQKIDLVKERIQNSKDVPLENKDLKSSVSKEPKLTNKPFENNKIENTNKVKEDRIEKKSFLEQIKKTETFLLDKKTETKISEKTENTVAKTVVKPVKKDDFFELKEKSSKIPKKKKVENSNISSIAQKDSKKNLETKSESRNNEINKIETKKVLKEDKKVVKNETSETIKIIQQKEDTKQKKSKIGYIIIPFLLIIAVGTYFIYNNIQQKQKEIEKDIELTKEKAILEADSILLYEKENKEKIVVEKSINISDTIFNIVSDYPEGYYVVVGSYADIVNAEKLQKNNPTIFESYIFEGQSKRVALLIGNNENTVLDNLETIRFKYPDAWIMYNKN